MLRAVRGRSTRRSKQRGGEDVILLCATRRAQDGIESGARNGGHGPAKWELFSGEQKQGRDSREWFFFSSVGRARCGKGFAAVLSTAAAAAPGEASG